MKTILEHEVKLVTGEFVSVQSDRCVINDEGDLIFWFQDNVNVAYSAGAWATCVRLFEPTTPHQEGGGYHSKL